MNVVVVALHACGPINILRTTRSKLINSLRTSTSSFETHEFSSTIKLIHVLYESENHFLKLYESVMCVLRRSEDGDHGPHR